MGQAIKFTIISGVGWLVDVLLFSVGTRVFSYQVGYANIISSIPAITLVFFVSTKNIIKNEGALELRYKYLIYVGYQVVLITVISFVGQIIFNIFQNTGYLSLTPDNNKLLVKIIITPITLLSNFFFMKFLMRNK